MDPLLWMAFLGTSLLGELERERQEAVAREEMARILLGFHIWHVAMSRDRGNFWVRVQASDLVSAQEEIWSQIKADAPDADLNDYEILAIIQGGERLFPYSTEALKERRIYAGQTLHLIWWKRYTVDVQTLQLPRSVTVARLLQHDLPELAEIEPEICFLPGLVILGGTVAYTGPGTRSP